MADQFFTVTSTYDPSKNEIACEPREVTVNKGNTGKVTVKLQVKAGQPGVISFKADPVKWTTPPPKDFLVTVSEILIIAPNSNTDPLPQKLSFEVNYVYTPPSGPVVSGTGDPTIILEGTGSSW